MPEEAFWELLFNWHFTNAKKINFFDCYIWFDYDIVKPLWHVWQYLNDTFGDYVQMVMDSTDSFEVDHTKDFGSNGSSSELQRRRERLINSCQLIWFKIVNSQAQIPL